MPTRTFKKTKEDFSCERCGTAVRGDGYTNHCPACLWSKHVDVFPGDRREKCGGMMKPIGVRRKGDTYSITHQCERCGAEKVNKMAPNDNFDALLAIEPR